MASKPIYTTFDSVKIELTNKVQFQSNPQSPADGELPDALLAQLISRAETQVEMELRSRYAIPFRSIRTGSFNDLPDHTKRAIQMVCDWRAVMEVLRTDYGRGKHIMGDNYYKVTEEYYNKEINRLLGRDAIGENGKIDRFKVSPPLEDLLLAPTNKEADDGYRGMIINTDASHDAATYAEEQIDDPSKSYIRRRGWGML